MDLAQSEIDRLINAEEDLDETLRRARKDSALIKLLNTYREIYHMSYRFENNIITKSILEDLLRQILRKRSKLSSYKLRAIIDFAYQFDKKWKTTICSDMNLYTN